jgi:AGZA family xanthine/uracil permease-like MFS transporter
MRYRWAAWGDVNAFFGLIIDNIAVLVLLVGSISLPEIAGPIHFTPQFVIALMVPGTALGVLIGDLVYTWMAFRLARRTGRDDVTAMPLGLDTPSTFAVGLLVLLPALRHWLEHHPDDRDTGMYFAWHVGAVILVLVGISKTAIAPLGNAVRRWVPRAGLLGSLAAIALALIAFLPLLFEIAAAPLAGLLVLAIILATLVARRPLPGHVPGALAAVVLGTGVFLLCRMLETQLGWPLVPAAEGFDAHGTVPPLPAEVWQSEWWQQVLHFALNRLPVILPFALATMVGGIDCTESAAAVGDEYDTRAILLTEGVASVAAGLAGGVVQNTPYIGHPAYKAMGGRAAYTLATALAVGLLGWSGGFTHVFEILPKAALFPILVFVGLEITAQSFHATPVKHYPAVAFAILPALAYLISVVVGQMVGVLVVSGQMEGAAMLEGLPVIQTLRCLANGFIVTSLLWGAALAALLDDRPRAVALYLAVAGVCSLVGIIHSPFADARIAWPWDVLADLPGSARYQTPYHWAGAYALMAILAGLLALHRQPTASENEQQTTPGEPPVASA